MFTEIKYNWFSTLLRTLKPKIFSIAPNNSLHDKKTRQRGGLQVMKKDLERKGLGLLQLSFRAQTFLSKIHQAIKVLQSHGFVNHHPEPVIYFRIPISFPTFVKAAIALSRCSVSWAAEIWTRMRAKPLATTG